MYSNHNLRADLQEWKNRLYKATYSQFGNQVKYFFNSLESNKQLAGLILEFTIQYPYTIAELSEMEDDYVEFEFENEAQNASCHYQFIKEFIKQHGYNLHNYSTFQTSSFEETKTQIIEEQFSPILNYLHDKLDKSNSTVYLLEKYKKRTEWFTKQSLLTEYEAVTKSYEQILEDDLRLFLFDQGIDYPFSTPKSSSGRADIVSSIDTEEPIIIEIKLIDKAKKYGKNRIKEGFTQVVKYTGDYHKDFGYLVIYNMDNDEIIFSFNDENKAFPPMLVVGTKIYFFVVINLYTGKSASKAGATSAIVITESFLIDNE